MIDLFRSETGVMTVTLTEQGDEEEFSTSINQEATAQYHFEPNVNPDLFVIANKDAMCFLSINSKGKHEVKYQLSSLTKSDFLIAFPAKESINKAPLVKQFDLSIVTMDEFMEKRRKNLESLVSAYHMMRGELLFSSTTIH